MIFDDTEFWETVVCVVTKFIRTFGMLLFAKDIVCGWTDLDSGPSGYGSFFCLSNDNYDMLLNMCTHISLTYTFITENISWFSVSLI